MRLVRGPDAITGVSRGNKTYKIVLKGGSGVAMHGAGISELPPVCCGQYAPDAMTVIKF